MNDYRFHLPLRGVGKITDQLITRFHEAGFVDETIVCRELRVLIGFHRKAESQEQAVSEARKAIAKAGYQAAGGPIL